MDLLKQNVGIDVSKDSFDAAFMVALAKQKIKIKGTRKFANTLKGIQDFIRWVDKFKLPSMELHVTMEATGVYYETLAYTLYDIDDTVVHVLLPNMAKKYFESLNVKTKTDKIDAKTIGQMGLERALEPWVLHSRIYRKLRTLTRERVQLINERTSIKNQLHAEEYSADTIKRSTTRYKNRIKYINKQIVEVGKDLTELVKSDNYVSKKVDVLSTIPGVSFITVVSIIAETGGFENFTSIKQLTSYSGLDVVHKESGKWKGKTKISKKGNSHIRRALYMPILSVVRYSNTFKTNYNRINEGKKFKMTGAVAMQRKVLGLMYTLWKNDTVYIEDYQNSIVA